MTELSTETGEYWELTLVCDGAFDEVVECATYADIESYLSQVSDDYTTYGYTSEWNVYSVYHPHAISEDDCECIQYETDHYPILTLGGES